MRMRDLMERSAKTKTQYNMFTMIKGRHETDAKKDLIEDLEDIFDWGEIYTQCMNKLGSIEDLHLFVTGATPVLGSILNYCVINRINVTLYHYDKVLKQYIVQVLYNEYDLIKEGGY